LTLTEPGQVQITAKADQATTEQPILISVLSPPAPTDTPTAVPTPTNTPTPISPTPTNTPALVTPTPTSLPPSPTSAPLPAPASPPPPINTREVDGVDLLSALAATLLAGLLGFWLGRQYNQPLSRRVHLGLWVLIGGLLAYLLYGAGWLRPELWLLETPNLVMERLSVAGLAFVFALGGLVLSHNRLRAKR
jgi:hypothetical protein